MYPAGVGLAKLGGSASWSGRLLLVYRWWGWVVVVVGPCLVVWCRFRWRDPAGYDLNVMSRQCAVLVYWPAVLCWAVGYR